MVMPWKKRITEDNIREMVMLIGKRPESDRFLRYFEGKDTLALIHANRDVYRAVHAQLSGMNQYVLECSAIFNKQKRYEMIVKKICDFSPVQFSALNVFLDVYDMASLTRDRCEICKDTAACEWFHRLVYGDPEGGNESTQLGLMGLWKFQGNIAAAEVLVQLGFITSEEVTKIIREREAQLRKSRPRLTGCGVCGRIFPEDKCVQAVWDDRWGMEWICRDCLDRLQAEGRVRQVKEPEQPPDVPEEPKPPIDMSYTPPPSPARAAAPKPEETVPEAVPYQPRKKAPGLYPGFSANVTEGEAPLTVQFKDESMGNPERLEWDFGDGNTSGERNPKHTYTAPGSYTVILTGYRHDGEMTQIKDSYITVREPRTPPAPAPPPRQALSLMEEEVRQRIAKIKAEQEQDQPGKGETEMLEPDEPIPTDMNEWTFDHFCIAVDDLGEMDLVELLDTVEDAPLLSGDDKKRLKTMIRRRIRKIRSA